MSSRVATPSSSCVLGVLAVFCGLLALVSGMAAEPGAGGGARGGEARRSPGHEHDAEPDGAGARSGSRSGEAGAPPNLVCPLEGVSRLGRGRADWERAAALAAEHPADSCRARAEALRLLFEDDVGTACEGLRIGDQRSPATDDGADLGSLTAALAWRCGEPARAHHEALTAIGRGRDAALAWRVLGQLLSARFRTGPARTAFDEALATDPDDPPSLFGKAGLERDRAKRRAALERYAAVGGSRGESDERVRAAADGIALIDALGDRDLWVVEAAELPGVLPLTPLWTRPGQLSGWTIDLPASGRRPLRALLDSGASGLHLSPTATKKLSVEPLAGGTLFGGGGDRRHEVVRGLISSLTIGPLAFRSALGVVAERSLHRQGRYQAIVGLDIFGGLLVRFETGERRVILERVDGGVADAAPTSRSLVDSEAGWTPVYRVEGQILVPVSLDFANGETISCLALFDTGASNSLLAASIAAERGAVRGGAGRRGAAYGGEREYLGSVTRLTARLGDTERRLENVAVIDLSDRARLAGVRVGAILGWDMLGANDFEIDLANGRVRFVPGGVLGRNDS